MFPGGSPAKSSIQEANKHLQALYSRVSELEETVQQKDTALKQFHQQHEVAIQQIIQAKNAEVATANSRMEVANLRVANLEAELAIKDKLISELTKQSVLLQGITKHRKPLQQLLKLMQSATKYYPSTPPEIDVPVMNGITSVTFAKESAVIDYSPAADRQPIATVNSSSQNHNFSINDGDNQDEKEDMESDDNKLREKDKEFYL